MTVELLQQRGWDIVRLRSGRVEVDVVPGKGGDILAVRWLPLGVNLLWSTPWGLRPKGAVPSGGDSTAHWLEHYPGGWQTIFPNGGDPAHIGGVEQGFHGEACLSPWEWEPGDGRDGSVSIELTTRLSRSPFTMRRRLTVTDTGLDVVETIENVGRQPLDVMWSHHPAFGAPFLTGDCVIDTAATWFEADDVRDSAHGDLKLGARSPWPTGVGRDGADVDLSRVPAEHEPLDRMGYLGGFETGWAAITNPKMGLRAELRWDASVFPHAWMWLEAHATDTFPWFAGAYVLAIEPASSYPGQGAGAAAAKTATLLRCPPGEARTVSVGLSVTEVPAT